MYNKAILIGRLVADPELKTTPNGVSVATFRVAVDRPFKQGGERKADFINVVAWRATAEFVARYFTKGKFIGVEGAIQTRDYTDKDGNKRYATEVIAEKCFFVGGKDNDNGGAAPHTNSGYEDVAVDDDNDLPF